jgi:antirestriction protein ArdC
MTTHKDTYQQITERIINLMESGVVPWRKPWRTSAPKSLASGIPYRGINTFVLSAAPYSAPYWVTFNQAKARGGNVRKGEKGWPLVFWKFITKFAEGIEQKDKETGEVANSYPILKSWTIFNVEQCEGLEYPVPAPRQFSPIEEAERIVSLMPNAPGIFHDGGSRAFYRPQRDTVHMPARESFGLPEEYYSTLFHEIAHSTGHSSRLDRPSVMDFPEFASHTYGYEELVAEMTAAMLCGVTGIEPRTIDNSAAYISSWLMTIRDDKRLLITAAGAAQKAADYILRQSASEQTGEDEAA